MGREAAAAQHGNKWAAARTDKEEGHLSHPICSVMSNRVERANHQSFIKLVANNQLQVKGGQILEVQAKMGQILKLPMYVAPLVAF